jgi:nucleoside-diphosphate-sugar epimerase
MSDAVLLVTGASGFIGARVVARALERGWRVVALVVPGDPCPRLDSVRQQIQVVEGTLAGLQAWQAQVANARPRACIHLAWNATPGVYLSTPENLDWLQWSCALLEHLPRWGCQRCVGVGSAAGGSATAPKNFVRGLQGVSRHHRAPAGGA